MSIYYCSKEENTCSKRETCKRYVEQKENCNHAPLFNCACTENNGHVLFLSLSIRENSKESTDETV